MTNLKERAGHGGVYLNTGILETEAEGSRGQSQTQLHSKFKANLVYVRF